MKKKLTDNLGLKILAVLCSVLLWLIVMNIDDPVKSNTFRDMEVVILNPQAVTDEGKVFEVLDGTDRIDVVVSAKRSIMNTLNRENIIVTADMSELTFMNTVRINVTTDRYDGKLEKITTSEENMRVNVENLKRVQMVVETSVSGSPGAGYMVNEVTTEQNLVRLSGAESVISNVAKAVLEVSVEGITTGIQADYPVKLYDAQGVEINSSNINKSISSIGVNVSVLQQKQVPLSLRATGTPAAGFVQTGVITSTPEEILIAGSSAALSSVTAIELPEGLLDVTGVNSDLVTLVDIRDYLPEGIILADSSFNGRVSVTVAIEEEQSARVEVNTEDIAIHNMPQGKIGEITAETETLSVEVAGLEQYITNVDGITVTGYVDVQALLEEGVEELENGAYQVPIILNLPEGIRIKTEQRVTLTIREDAGEAEN